MNFNEAEYTATTALDGTVTLVPLRPTVTKINSGEKYVSESGVPFILVEDGYGPNRWRMMRTGDGMCLYVDAGKTVEGMVEYINDGGYKLQEGC